MPTNRRPRAGQSPKPVSPHRQGARLRHRAAILAIATAAATTIAAGPNVAASVAENASLA